MLPPFIKTSSMMLSLESVKQSATFSDTSTGYSKHVRHATYGTTPGSPVTGASATAFAPLYKDLLYDNIGQYQTPKSKAMYNKLMRQIYQFDPIAGPATDLFSEMPWSQFDLSGIEDKAILHIYEDALNNLNLPTYLPDISRNWYVHGRVCLHFLFDASKGIWTSLILHDDNDIRIIPVPLLNEDPLVELIPSPALKQFALEDDPRMRVYRDKLPPEVIAKIRSGQVIPLDNSNTIYLPRKTVSNDVIGTTFYSRIIGLITLERALFNASVSRAQRSAGTIRVLKIGRSGPDGWLPTDEEVNAAISSLMIAEEDPTGSAIGFKTQDIDISAIAGSAADNLWKISDEADYIEKAKYKALGISEALMSGDATINNVEQALSMSLERIKTHRAYFTRKIIIERLFEPLAKVHGFKKKNAKTAGFWGSDRTVIRESNDAQLILPSIQWAKPLEPRMDQTIIDLLEKAEELGLNVPLRTWATVLGLNATELLSHSKEDIELRKKFAKIRQERDSIGSPTAPSPGGGGGEGGGPSDLGGPKGGEPEGEGGEGEGPAMEKVEPEENSVVDKVPPPPGEAQEPSSVNPWRRADGRISTRNRQLQTKFVN